MVTKELVAYIRDQLQLSIGDIIRQDLQSHGWQEADIAEAFRIALRETPYSAAPVPKKRSHKVLIVFILLLILIAVPFSLGVYAYFFLPNSPIHNLFNQAQTVDNQKPTPSSQTPTPSAPAEGFSDIFAKVRDTQRKADLSKIVLALEAYFSEKNSYPSSLDDLISESFTTAPKDPKTQGKYTYSNKESGLDYELCAEFETLGRKCVSSVVKVTDL